HLSRSDHGSCLRSRAVSLLVLSLGPGASSWPLGCASSSQGHASSTRLPRSLRLAHEYSNRATTFHHSECRHRDRRSPRQTSLRFRQISPAEALSAFGSGEVWTSSSVRCPRS